MKGLEEIRGNQSMPVGYHRGRGELACAVMRPHAGAEHRIPPPQGLFPERLGPGECPILNHMLVAAPDVVDKDIDSGRLTADALERPRHLCIQPVVTANAGNALVIDCTVLRRAARHKHPRTVAGKLACDPSTNTKGTASHDGDIVLYCSHRRNYSEIRGQDTAFQESD